MHNTYACERSSGQQHALGREYMLVARSVGTSFTPGYYAGHVWYSHMAVDSHMRLRELFSPPEGGMGFGEARSGLEISLDLSMT